MASPASTRTSAATVCERRPCPDSQPQPPLPCRNLLLAELRTQASGPHTMPSGCQSHPDQPPMPLSVVPTQSTAATSALRRPSRPSSSRSVTATFCCVAHAHARACTRQRMPSACAIEQGHARKAALHSSPHAWHSILPSKFSCTACNTQPLQEPDLAYEAVQLAVRLYRQGAAGITGVQPPPAQGIPVDAPPAQAMYSAPPPAQ